MAARERPARAGFRPPNRARRGENGTLDDHAVGTRLAELRESVDQLATRRDELAQSIKAEPITPEPALLDRVAEYTAKITRSGSDRTRKALIEALIAEIRITSPSTVVPVFRIPQPDTYDVTTTQNNRPTAENGDGSTVRAMSILVELTSHNPNRLTLQGSVVRVRPVGVGHIGGPE